MPLAKVRLTLARVKRHILVTAGDEPPFQTLNARLYSPGCLILAAALLRPAS